MRICLPSIGSLQASYEFRLNYCTDSSSIREDAARRLILGWIGMLAFLLNIVWMQESLCTFGPAMEQNGFRFFGKARAPDAVQRDC